MMITQVHIKQVSVLFTIARDRLGPPEVARQVWHVASWGFKMLNQDYESRVVEVGSYLQQTQIQINLQKKNSTQKKSLPSLSNIRWALRASCFWSKWHPKHLVCRVSCALCTSIIWLLVLKTHTHTRTDFFGCCNSSFSRASSHAVALEKWRYDDK